MREQQGRPGRSRSRDVMPVLTVFLALAVVATACGDTAADGGGDAFARGERSFANNCAVCHGEAGVGTAAGPPLVHVIYEPSHHSDASFQAAVANGVVAHHWDFGPMPTVPGLDSDEVDDIITYVRALQREAGIE